ncbi:hypothetical protein A2865_01720 [Candidatus Woesebacteria bacterium RIFCSPHIGHO2_01_FULL_39_17]|uniref:Transcriptional regulator MraZ n=2 Tax=Candidatus Woeseibacteriota TaxID=1752722 RepID=A0A0G0QS16_9BACT|nr:MAG: Protein MraZ [Microgenomates group bacterium GW2011_GWC1_38_12]KKR13155.1 MAG: Protein MraZ [Candidatus Woesebacteria bacterium GW2011_GWA1_39_21b]OGM22308.1 MAG: hypothetical protein A2865_01720 [Candidatus Woesebacteria bacterium RIFCSPHIGHO2_01_FULL_39_17]OGM61857.1 MAG: hypothetical protein A3A52_01745 [Candidatus Woesebacteria bacterium RIFCSPLOWO2_01_FULL_39_14]
MFLGTYLAKFAAGRRVAVPAPLRRDLGESFILAKWYEGCLVLVARDSWEALLKRLTGSQKMLPTPVRDTERFIFSSAYESVPDDQGRIVIPDRLVSYANLEDELYFIGLGDRIEIWNKESWLEKEKSLAKDSAAYIEELARDERKRQ